VKALKFDFRDILWIVMSYKFRLGLNPLLVIIFVVALTPIPVIIAYVYGKPINPFLSALIIGSTIFPAFLGLLLLIVGPLFSVIIITRDGVISISDYTYLLSKRLNRNDIVKAIYFKDIKKAGDFKPKIRI